MTWGCPATIIYELWEPLLNSLFKQAINQHSHHIFLFLLLFMCKISKHSTCKYNTNCILSTYCMLWNFAYKNQQKVEKMMYLLIDWWPPVRGTDVWWGKHGLNSKSEILRSVYRPHWCEFIEEYLWPTYSSTGIEKVIPISLLFLCCKFLWSNYLIGMTWAWHFLLNTWVAKNCMYYVLAMCYVYYIYC